METIEMKNWEEGEEGGGSPSNILSPYSHYVKQLVMMKLGRASMLHCLPVFQAT